MATLRNRIEALEKKRGINFIHVVPRYAGETHEEALAYANVEPGTGNMVIFIRRFTARGDNGR